MKTEAADYDSESCYSGRRAFYTRVKDDEGRTIQRKESYIHRLMAEEYIPETDEEKERLEKEGEKKVKKHTKED